LNTKLDHAVAQYNAVLKTVQLLATVLPYDADTLNDLICDNGVHHELLTVANPSVEEYGIGGYADAVDEFDENLFDFIEKGVNCRMSNSPESPAADTRVITLRE